MFGDPAKAGLAGFEAIWAIAGIVLAIDVAWAMEIGLSIGGVGPSAGAILLMLALAVVYRRRNRAIADMAAATAAWGAIVSTGAVLTYLAASCALPVQDETIARLDGFVGFDWLAWRDALLNQPILKWMLLLAYYSMQLQVALSIIYFAGSEKVTRISELLLLAAVSLLATVLISAIWPALGPFAAYGDTNGGYPFTDLLAMRAGGPWHFYLLTMQGIVNMPSYHTVMAVLFTYAFRGTGWVGCGIAALNAVMLLSIPPIGGHYLADVLAGAGLALAAIAAHRAWLSAKDAPPARKHKAASDLSIAEITTGATRSAVTTR